MWFSFRLYEIQQVHGTAFVLLLQMLELLAFVNRTKNYTGCKRTYVALLKGQGIYTAGSIVNFSWAGSGNNGLISTGMQFMVVEELIELN